jgi:hypothetical protein
VVATITTKVFTVGMALRQNFVKRDRALIHKDHFSGALMLADFFGLAPASIKSDKIATSTLLELMNKKATHDIEELRRTVGESVIPSFSRPDRLSCRVYSSNLPSNAHSWG